MVPARPQTVTASNKRMRYIAQHDVANIQPVESKVGQVGNLRPIGNRPACVRRLSTQPKPTSAGPAKLLRSGNQPSLHRIHLDVPRNPPKLRFIPHQMIVTRILPKRLSGKPQNPISLPGCKPLERVHQLRNLHLWSNQSVNMVSHDDKGMKVQLFLPKTQRLNYHLRNIISSKVKRPGPALIENSIHSNKRSSGGNCRREKAVSRETAVKTPGDEQW